VTNTTEIVSQTNTTTVAFGPTTILIGDNQSQTFVIAAGNTDINVNTNTEYVQSAVVTNTTEFDAVYSINGTRTIKSHDNDKNNGKDKDDHRTDKDDHNGKDNNKDGDQNKSKDNNKDADQNRGEDNNKDTDKSKGKDDQSAYAIDGYRTVSPIVLNLNGTGYLEASAGRWFPHPQQFFVDRRALFDFYGNGFPVAMEWVGPNDGLLCRPHPDGSVDGSCLFGTATGFKTGYEQLASLDENLDGYLTGKELAGLMVWQDKNGNARVDAGELRSVKECGITEIGIRNTNARGTFVMNGKKQVMFDWWPTVLSLRKVHRGSI